MKGENKVRIIVNNRDVEFVFCHLVSFLSQCSINLSLKSYEEEDLIEEEEQSGTLTVEQITSQENSVHPTFTYKSKIGKH